jgi:hypothetical protein
MVGRPERMPPQGLGMSQTKVGEETQVLAFRMRLVSFCFEMGCQKVGACHLCADGCKVRAAFPAQLDAEARIQLGPDR